jgi:hypothetical protein
MTHIERQPLPPLTPEDRQAFRLAGWGFVRQALVLAAVVLVLIGVLVAIALLADVFLK